MLHTIPGYIPFCIPHTLPGRVGGYGVWNIQVCRHAGEGPPFRTITSGGTSGAANGCACK